MDKKFMILFVIGMFALSQLALVAVPQTQTELIIDEATFPSCTTYSGDMGKAYFEGNALNYTTTDTLQLACKEHAFTDLTFEANITQAGGDSIDVAYGLSFGFIVQDDDVYQNYELILSDGLAAIFFTVWPSQDTVVIKQWVEIPDFQAEGANHLKVVIADGSIQAYVNDTQLGPIQAPYPVAGHVGFSMYNFGDVSQEQHVVFGNMHVTGNSTPVDGLGASSLGLGLPLGESLFSTDFSSIQDWRIDALAEHMGYVVEPRSTGVFVVVPEAYDGIWLYHMKFPSLSNVRLETEVELVGGTNYTVISFICRSNDDGEYVFMLDMGGFWGIGKWFAGFSDYEDLAAGGSTAINAAKSLNNVVVECNGSDLSMTINGEEVGRVQDHTFISGEIGIGVETVDNPLAEVLFRELEVAIP